MIETKALLESDMRGLAGSSTIYDPDFELRVMARARIDAGQLPELNVPGDLLQHYSEHPEICDVCNRNIAAEEPWVRLTFPETDAPNPCVFESRLHELCYLAWWTEVLEGQ